MWYIVHVHVHVCTYIHTNVRSSAKVKVFGGLLYIAHAGSLQPNRFCDSIPGDGRVYFLHFYFLLNYCESFHMQE